MYDSGVNSESVVNYNLLFCHACLSSNRKLTMVGDYVDVYRKICDNSRMPLTSQINVCWECMALLKKIRAFKKKVDNAQKILDYCVNKHTPLLDSLSDLTVSHTENTTFVPILDDVEEKLASIKTEPVDEDMFVDVCKDYREEPTLFKIEDVRGQFEIDVKPVLDISSSSSCNVKIKCEPGSPEAEEEKRHQRWKRSVMLVYRRLCTHKYACHFLRPVSDELAPQYSSVVRRPVDLSSIRRRIRSGAIRTTAEFQRDLLLMFSNALMYNSSQHIFFHMARELQQEALREVSLLLSAQAAAESPAPPESQAAAEAAAPPEPRRRRRQSHRTAAYSVRDETYSSLPARTENSKIKV